MYALVLIMKRMSMIRAVVSLVLVLAVILTASAYVNTHGEDVGTIPSAVQQKVRELFPEAAAIEWEKERKGNYEAEFVLKGKEVEILLDENGNVLQLEKEVDRSELPAEVNAELDKRNFIRVARVIYLKQGSNESYRIIGLTEDKRIKITYDLGGKLVSETVIDRNKKQRINIPLPSGGLASYEKKWELPFILREISGIALLGNDRVACVQDELGAIFIVDLNELKIVSEIPFGEPGDHEGIALVNNDAWILRSDGKLYEVKDFLSEQPRINEHILLFDHPQNLEGLCYDKANNRLLIAPREYDTENIMYKGIYSFNLSTNKFSKEPVFRIKMEDPVLADVRPKAGKARLMPSAIGVHPLTGKIYITDARNSQVLITDKSGKPEKLIRLNKNVHPKTEGIAFTPSGDIYLSNEGKKQSPNIVLLEKGALE